MSKTTTPLPDSGTSDSRASAPASAAHRLVVIASVIALAADVVLMAIIGAVIPPLLVFAVLTAVVVVAARRWPRSGLIGLGLIALAANGGGLEFLAADLSSPADPIAFLWAVLSGGGRLVALVGVALALLRRDDAARRLAVASLGILVVAAAASTIARVSTSSSDGQEDGDVAVAVTGFTYPDEVTVATGGALYVDNRDPVRHTFAIEGTDLDVRVEPGVGRRVVIDLPAGTYDFLCTVPGHEFMTGTLEVK